MKILYPAKSYRYHALALALTIWLIQPRVQAQTAANWSFSNSLASTPGTHLAAPNISLGSAILSNAFNSGTEFFGQDGWPSGALDPNAYLQFTVSPNAGYYAVLNSIVLVMRHSSLGTAAGSGPASWSLRSSLDGYTTDIYTANNLTASYQTFTIPLPAAFQGVNTAVTFRIYGYNQTTTAGGLNRFVFDNISISGQAISGVLATQSIDLTAKTSDLTTGASGTVDLQWQTIGFPTGTSLAVERSVNGTDFVVIGQQTALTSDASDYRFEDASALSGNTLFYRIVANEPGGLSFYSPVIAVSVPAAASGASIKGAVIRGVIAQGTSVKALLQIQETGIYQLSIWSRDGRALHRQMINGTTGDVSTDISFGAYPHGIYVLTLTKDGVNSSRQFMF